MPQTNSPHFVFPSVFWFIAPPNIDEKNTLYLGICSTKELTANLNTNPKRFVKLQRQLQTVKSTSRQKRLLLEL